MLRDDDMPISNSSSWFSVHRPTTVQFTRVAPSHLLFVIALLLCATVVQTVLTRSEEAHVEAGNTESNRACNIQ